MILADEFFALFNQLRLEAAQIANAASNPLDREGLDAYSVGGISPALDYEAFDTSGKRIMLKHVRATTDRTAALGLDDEIESFNKAALKLNKLTSEGATSTDEYSKTLAAYNKELAKIQLVEGSPSSAQGTVKPKLVDEEYPKRVQELAKLAFANQPLNMSQADIELLEKYPSVGRAVLEYADFKKRFPDTKLVAQTVQRKLDAVQAAGFKLKPSERPFAEGLHIYPKTVQNVVNRIAQVMGEML